MNKEEEQIDSLRSEVSLLRLEVMDLSNECHSGSIKIGGHQKLIIELLRDNDLMFYSIWISVLALVISVLALAFG